MCNIKLGFIYQIEKTFDMFIISRNHQEQKEFFDKMENLKDNSDCIAFYKGYLMFKMFYNYIQECFHLIDESDKINLFNEIKTLLIKKYGNYCEIKDDIILNETIIKILDKLAEFLNYIYEEINNSIISNDELNEFNNSFNINDVYNFINKGEDNGTNEVRRNS